MKLRPVRDGGGNLVGYSFKCPGCDETHVFWTAGKCVWEFNGDLDKPTFQPSLRNSCPNHKDPKLRMCHLHLVAGRLCYYADCSHALAGKVADLPDAWPDEPQGKPGFG